MEDYEGIGSPTPKLIRLLTEDGQNRIIDRTSWFYAGLSAADHTGIEGFFKNLNDEK
jgi:hypothetical protein